MPFGTILRLAALEKKCGTANVIKAIQDEEICYSDGVKRFLKDDPEEGTFYYICEFAHVDNYWELYVSKLPKNTRKTVAEWDAAYAKMKTKAEADACDFYHKFEED